MVTPFEVYLVMQLDSIGSTLSFFAIAGLLIGLLLCLFGGIEEIPGVLSWGKKAVIGALVLGLLNGFLPSTKTAAAMILLPALTSEEVTEPLSREAGELYELAKSALRNAADKPAPKPEPDK